MRPQKYWSSLKVFGIKSGVVTGQKEIHNMKIRKINTNLEEYFCHPLDLRPVNNQCGVCTLIMGTAGMTIARQLLLRSIPLEPEGTKTRHLKLSTIQYSTIQYNIIISIFQQNSFLSSLRATTHDTWILVGLSYFGWPWLHSIINRFRRLSMMITSLKDIIQPHSLPVQARRKRCL